MIKIIQRQYGAINYYPFLFVKLKLINVFIIIDKSAKITLPLASSLFTTTLVLVIDFL